VRSPLPRPAALAALVVAGASLFVACGTDTATTGSGAAPGPSASATAAATASDADAGDVAFAQMMIPHHQQAVEMADLALEQAQSPEVLALAQQIQGAQQPEIDEMTTWLQDWGAPVPTSEAAVDHSGHDMGGMGAGTGMMSAEQMDDLAAASGAEFDQMWLDMMIVHHEGAIAMSRQVLDTTSDPRVERMAQAIIDGQTAEIATMQQLIDA
jgi:uncharacterized protein (DUF305 family)